MFSLGSILFKEDDGVYGLEIGTLHFILDNHQPRKNTGKPHRGWFDVGHFDVIADLKLKIDYLNKDSVHGYTYLYVQQRPL